MRLREVLLRPYELRGGARDRARARDLPRRGRGPRRPDLGGTWPTGAGGHVRLHAARRATSYSRHPRAAGPPWETDAGGRSHAQRRDGGGDGRMISEEGGGTKRDTRRRRILVVDDERGILVYVGANLRQQGYEVVTAQDGRQALEAAALRPPDLVILDLAMPELDGFETLGRLREWTPAPVLVLSAHADEVGKVRALDLGADDYLTKPFSVQELLARVRVALRRVDTYGAPAGGPALDLGGPAALVVDLARRVVTRGGEEVHLTRTEYELLAYLARRLDRVVS